MIIFLFVIMFALFMFTSFTATFHLQTVNRAIIYTPIELFESSLVTVNREDETILYFDEEALLSNLSTYYEEVINRHLTSYTMSHYFYNQEDGSLCVNNRCDAVEITIDGHYSYFFRYTRSIKYEIHKGAMYGQ